MHRGFRYRLYPTTAQAETLGQWVGAARFTYNLCLEQRRDFWRQFQRATGRPLTWVEQSRQVTELRAEVDWLREPPRNALDRALRDLDAAFTAFFAGRARYPQPRVRGLNDSLRLKAEDVAVKRLNRKWSAIRLPKLGWVKFRDTREMIGRLLNVTFSRRGDGWHVAFAREVEDPAVSTAHPAVGIDRGVAQTLTLSTGEHIQAPNCGRLLAIRKRAQRRLARSKRGGSRYAVQRAKTACLSARAARIRTDWCHRASTDLARRFGLVGIEALQIANMTASASGAGRARKAGLNRSILEQCWGKFASFLDYKLTERGGMLISVPAAYTSQTCAGCGAVDARSRKSQAVFACVHCGHEDNADVNAAKEILRRSTALLDVEGSHWGPREASTRALPEPGSPGDADTARRGRGIQWVGSVGQRGMVAPLSAATGIRSSG